MVLTLLIGEPRCSRVSALPIVRGSVRVTDDSAEADDDSEEGEEGAAEPPSGRGVIDISLAWRIVMTGPVLTGVAAGILMMTTPTVETSGEMTSVIMREGSAMMIVKVGMITGTLATTDLRRESLEIRGE
jgi:hypothetical protein